MENERPEELTIGQPPKLVPQQFEHIRIFVANANYWDYTPLTTTRSRENFIHCNREDLLQRYIRERFYHAKDSENLLNFIDSTWGALQKAEEYIASNNLIPAEIDENSSRERKLLATLEHLHQSQKALRKIEPIHIHKLNGIRCCKVCDGMATSRYAGVSHAEFCPFHALPILADIRKKGK